MFLLWYFFSTLLKTIEGLGNHSFATLNSNPNYFLAIRDTGLRLASNMTVSMDNPEIQLTIDDNNVQGGIKKFLCRDPNSDVVEVCNSNNTKTGGFQLFAYNNHVIFKEKGTNNVLAKGKYDPTTGGFFLTVVSSITPENEHKVLFNVTEFADGKVVKHNLSELNN